MIKKYQQKKALHMKKMCFSIFVCIAFCGNILSSEKKDPFWKEVSVANIMEMQKTISQKEKENQQLRKEVVWLQQQKNAEGDQFKKEVALYQEEIESLKVALEEEEAYPLHH
ncbi:MAG TPA: hypothetical protein VKU36_03355 [Candidatus Babeliales bacterium]|nr:hypothetical protein [Candidatus Babeliales bacterium]